MKKLLLLLSLLLATVAGATIRQDLRLVGAHLDRHVNRAELHRQYQANQPIWDSVFCWMASHDIESMPAGKYYVCDTVLISIQDATTRAESKIEGHMQKIDLQWTISGTEVYHQFRFADLDITTPYNPKKDVRFFTPKPGKTPRILVSSPSVIYLFFPSDPHRALLQSGQPAPIRKVVAKIPYSSK